MSKYDPDALKKLEEVYLLDALYSDEALLNTDIRSNIVLELLRRDGKGERQSWINWLAGVES